jgi:hypothetical protein
LKFPFKITGQILDRIGTISIHAYGEDTERIAESVRSVRSIKTLPFIGEFGVSDFCS